MILRFHIQGKSRKYLRFLRAAGPLTGVVLGTVIVKVFHPSSISLVRIAYIPVTLITGCLATFMKIFSNYMHNETSLSYLLSTLSEIACSTLMNLSSRKN